MSEMSKFESRVGSVKQSSKTVHTFVTDMRNFHQFIPGDKLTNWKAEKDNCEFEIAPIGKAKLKIIESDPYKVVKFEGVGLNNTTFFLWVQLKEVSENETKVKITIKADLNPMIKMMAAKPLKDFLEKLVSGIESYDGWNKVSD